MLAPLNLIGERFGRLTILGLAGGDNHDKTACLCLCDCGIRKTIGGYSLLSGNTKSCGCLRRELLIKRYDVDRVGQRFGRLTVLAGKGRDKRRRPVWACRCDCGTEKIISAGSLLSGKTKSCGCRQREYAESCTGAKNTFWKGGITPKNKLIRESKNYKNWRATVFVRDNFLCQECGAAGEIQAHHIKSFSAFPELRFEISNGQTLCVPCHKKTDTFGGKSLQKII